MPTPIYTQVDSLRLYALSPAETDSNYWTGYLPSADAQVHTTIYPYKTWDDVGGVYLFLNETPEDFSTFLDDLNLLLPKLSPTGEVRILWILNPQSPCANWQWDFLKASASQNGDGSTTWSVARQAIFQLGTYSFAIEPGAAMTLADTYEYAIKFSADHVNFLGPNGVYPAQGETAFIPMTGTTAGSLAAYLTMTGSDAFSGLGVMLCYATPNRESDPFNPVAALNMPVLGLPTETTLDLKLSFDPLNPLDPDRSHLSFFPYESTNPPALDSGFVTTFGVGTTLTPAYLEAPLRPGRLVFNRSPMSLPTQGEASYYNYYLTPDGAFTLALVNPPAGQSQNFMLGLSALEYVSFPSTPQPIAALCFFQAGQPAYMPAPTTPGDPTSPDISQAFSDVATTAYLSILPAASGSATGLTYYAQPVQAALFTIDGKNPDFLKFHGNMPASILPSYTTGDTTPPKTYSVGCYKHIDSSQFDLARTLENTAIAPFRRYEIGKIGTPPQPIIPPQQQVESAEPALAVTPKGLVAYLTEDKQSWAGVKIAHMPKSTKNKNIDLSYIGPHLLAALQSNQVFFVVSNTAAFLADSPVSEELIADMEGWHFNLTPDNWRTTEDGTQTLMIFKFCDQSLAEMAADTRCWSWPGAAKSEGGSLAATQEALQPFLAEPDSTDSKDPLRIFYEQVVCNPRWNGVLFLNAPVSISTMPAPLKFLTAGVDRSRFYAHHVGFSVTPIKVADATITQEQTAAFGLIDYQDPVDLYTNETVPFGFKTKRLLARFANAALVDFKARAELLTNVLFGAELTKIPTVHGNNLILDGRYQMVHGTPVYSFALDGDNVFYSRDSALERIEILGVTLQNRQRSTDSSQLETEFTLRGNMKFKQFLPFDLFSYGDAPALQGAPPVSGYLRFGNLSVGMSFDTEQPTQKTFTVAEDRLNFDLSNSQARPGSLVAKFPLTLSGFAAPKSGKAKKGAKKDTPSETSPKDQGFVSIVAPLDQSLLTDPWYGLIFTLDLGTLGALAGSVGLTIRLLAGWAPGQHQGETPVYLGLEMPNGKSLEHNLPLQGVLSLGFKSFQFETYEDDITQETGYMLRMQQFALRILGLSFPPGNTDIVLFGNPQGGTKLGWYAAYAKNASGGTSGNGETIVAGSAATRRLQSGRRHRPVMGGL